MLNFDNNQFKPKGDSSLIYGCQPLHATINTLNCLLNLSCRKKLDLWQVKGEENKKALTEEKDRVRHKVEDFFKIKIDRPCQGGQGNTTTGNLCQRLFSKPHDLAKILELDDELVSNLSTILAALNCHEHLDFENLGLVFSPKLDGRMKRIKHQVSEAVKNFLLFKNYEQVADWDTTTEESNFMDLNEDPLIDYFEDMDLDI